MSTNGAFGFFVNGKSFVTYNHCDSYPDGLGQIMAEATIKIRDEFDIDVIKEKISNICLVETDSIPTQKEIKCCEKYIDLRVSEQSSKDWYCLLRNAQYNPMAWIGNDLSIMIDNIDNLSDSLFCEWAYIINLDTRTLEVYKGLQESEHSNGRYANNFSCEPEFYPVSLIYEIPFTQIDSETMKEIEEKIRKEEDAEV